MLGALHRQHAGDGQTRIIEEMGVWSGSVRIDVAVINGELQGFELKSARDTLSRLPAQANLYSQVFDRVTLVTAERHFCAAKKKIPKWWGITLAFPEKVGEIGLRDITMPKLNPSIDPVQLARLLWRSEALKILETHGIDRGVRSAPVEAMTLRLSERLTLETLRLEVRTTLKNRSNWLGQPVRN